MDFDTKQATVRHDATRIGVAQLRVANDRTGFPGEVVSEAGKPVAQATQKGPVDAMNDLKPLFSLELQYKGPIELAPIGDKTGQLVGGGDGSVTGPRLQGTVRWSNYETTGHDGVCTLQVPGIIHTEDGAEIQFEGHEMAMPVSDASKQWRVAGVMRFKTGDKRYGWLNETLAVISGTFDYDAGMARWSAFVPTTPSHEDACCSVER